MDKAGAEELKLGCWKMAELRSGGGRDARVWELEGKGVAGRSFDIFERGEGGDSKDNGGNIGADVSIGVPCNDV